MTDKEFLSWIYDRMIYKHGENKNVDYMLKFRSIIESLQEEPLSEKLEEAAKNHAVERYRTTRDRELAEKCKWSFITGAKWKDKHLENNYDWLEYQLNLKLPETLDYNGIKVDRVDFIKDIIQQIKS